MGFHANTFNRSLVLDLILFFFQTMPHENKMQFLGRAIGTAEKKSITAKNAGNQPISFTAYTSSKLLNHS